MEQTPSNPPVKRQEKDIFAMHDNTNHDAAPAAIANAESVAPQPTANERSGNPTSHSGTGRQPAPPCVETDRPPCDMQSPAASDGSGESSLRDVPQLDNSRAAGGPGHHISDRSKPIKDDLSDRSKPINDNRLSALEELSAMDQELELEHGITGNPMIKARRNKESAGAGITDAGPRLRQMNDVLKENERLRGQLAWTERERDSLRVSINNLRDYVAELNAELYAKSDEKCVLYDTNHDAAPAARASLPTADHAVRRGCESGCGTGNTHRSVEESSRPRRAHNPEIAGANPAAPTLDAALEAIADLPDERPPNAVSANGGTACAASRDGSGTSNTPPPHPTPPQGSVQDEGGFRDSQNAKEPVAWAVETGGELEASFCGPAGREDAADWREQSDGVIVPLYRHPHRPLGDPEIAVELLKDRVAELERAFNLIARADGTMSVVGGNVVVTVYATLTDEEREAVRTAMNAFAEDNANPECAAIEATLWGLLERLGGGS